MLPSPLLFWHSGISSLVQNKHNSNFDINIFYFFSIPGQGKILSCTELSSHDRDHQSTARHCHSTQHSGSCPFKYCLLPKRGIQFLRGFRSLIRCSFPLFVYISSTMPPKGRGRKPQGAPTMASMPYTSIISLTTIIIKSLWICIVALMQTPWLTWTSSGLKHWAPHPL